METQQIEHWEQYLERTVKNCTGLDEETIETLMTAVESEYLLHALNDLPEEEINKNTKSHIDKLFKKFRRAEGVAGGATDAVSPTLKIGRFPVQDMASISGIQEPLPQLEALMAELRQHGDYLRIREQYCRLSLAVNVQGLLAPAFRPVLKTGRKKGDKIFHVINRDHIVIDCHWLHTTKQFVRTRSKDIEFQAMFSSGKSFPLDLACAFSEKIWSGNHRATDMLRLTEFQQCQLKALRSNYVKAKIKGIEDGTRKDGHLFPSPQAVFEQALNAWCERDIRMYRNRDGYLAVWKARQFLGEKASVSQICKLAAMMLGELPKDEKTIRTKEKNIIGRILGG